MKDVELKLELLCVVVCCVPIAVATGLMGEKFLSVMFGATGIWATKELLR
jgi:hypothetical protein